MTRLITPNRICASFVAGFLAILSSCSSQSPLEAKCALAKEQNDRAIQQMYEAAAEKIRWAWAPDIGKGEGAARTVQVSIQGHQAQRDLEYELNDLAYRTCLRSGE